jgi:hypothetical protein
MRFWPSGPRVFGLRQGNSFGPEDFRRRRAARWAYGTVPVATREPRTDVMLLVLALLALIIAPWGYGLAAHWPRDLGLDAWDQGQRMAREWKPK